MKVKVISPFIDKYKKVRYEVGSVLEIDDTNRVKDLIHRKLVEKVEENEGITLFGVSVEKGKLVEALKSLGVNAAMNWKDATLLSKVEDLSEEEAEELKSILLTE